MRCRFENDYIDIKHTSQQPAVVFEKYRKDSTGYDQVQGASKISLSW